MPDIYISHGYADRAEYLEFLADEYGIESRMVWRCANALGPNEDFDGLVTALEDYAR